MPVYTIIIVYTTFYWRRRSKKTSKLRVTGLCDGNSPVTIWWRHHGHTDMNANTGISYCLCTLNRRKWLKSFPAKSEARPPASIVLTLFPLNTWWRHQMETFSALLALCAGNSPVPVNSPHKGQWRGALMFSLIWVWINSWVNNREAGDLRRYRAHCDVIVMSRG